MRIYMDMSMTMEYIIRLIVAGVMGALIGLDREYRAKDAGYRTHFLVSLGSALIMIVSQYGFTEVLGKMGVGLDPSRIAAQVYRSVNYHTEQTDCEGTYNGCRYLGYGRHRFVYRCRDVLDGYIGYHSYAYRVGIADSCLQKSGGKKHCR